MKKKTCVTVKSGPHFTLQKCDALSILWLKGSPIERARAHGELLGKEFTLANLEMFFELSVRGLDKKSFKYHVVNKAIDILVSWAASDAPKSYFDETTSLAQGAGQDPSRMRRAIFLPDLSAFSWALLSEEGKNLPTQGCTSAIFSDAEGNFLQGRNLDFPGSPTYDKNPLLVVHIPEANSKELKHVSVGTQGLQFSGITGFNEAGITFAVHQNYTRLISVKGIPMPYVGELVLRSARNIDDAIEIIKANRPGPLWSFVISDLNTNEAASVEVSNSHLHVRTKMGLYHSQTNHLTPNLAREVALMEAGTTSNSGFRFQKALEEMGTWKRPTPEKMARLLGWQKNRNHFSPISDLMKSLTIQSVIYEKTNLNKLKKFYVTIDEAPSPIGRWMEFDMNVFWNSHDISENDFSIHNFHEIDEEVRTKQKKWTEIYAAHIFKDFRTVEEKLEPIAESPDAFLALSSVQMKLNKVSESLIAAQKGLKSSNDETPKLIRQGLMWMEIISLYKLHQKDAALAIAVNLTDSGIIDPGLEKEVKKILKNQSPSDSSLSPDFDFFGGYLLGMPTRPKD